MAKNASITPLHDRVIVKPAAAEEKTAGGIIIPDTAKEKPQRGNGHHVAEANGVTYVFATDENKKAFVANPQKYLPQFGGYCAYGVSVSKKFVADPEQFDIVDGKLYLNLDAKIRSIWLKDTASRISDGNSNWKVIANKKASEL